MWGDYIVNYMSLIIPPSMMLEMKTERLHSNVTSSNFLASVCVNQIRSDYAIVLKEQNVKSSVS